KMFITDLDGTLFTDNKQISQLDFDSLEMLGKMGIIRVFATGRSLYSFQKAFEQIGFDKNSYAKLPVDYLVFSTGAGIMELTGEETREDIINLEPKIIKKHSLTTDDVIHIADYFDSLKLDYMIHRPVPDSHYFIYKEHNEKEDKSLKSDFNLRVEIYQDFIKKIDYQGSVRDFGEATELLSIVPAQYGHKTADMIEQALSKFSVVRATSPLDGSSVWIEVFNKMVSKSRAISWLADEIGIKQQNVAAVGNDYNDLDMLKWAGHSFLVKNAPKELKDKLKNQEQFQEVKDNNKSGVADAINIFLKH
ncbi:MAG: HAD-IIB family hydrolase, partial [Desulfamplus sp.]|nr:HAD-IIB family hydrolase [Desulfamplus sp.]